MAVWHGVRLGLVAQARYATAAEGRAPLHNYFFEVRGICELLCLHEICVLWSGVKAVASALGAALGRAH